MKRLLTISIAFIFVSMNAQLSIPPAKGDRFNYFLIGDVWVTSYSHNHSGFAVKVFKSDDRESTWIQNLGMKESQFIMLMKYINSLPELTAGQPSKVLEKGSDEWVVDSFHIYDDYFDNPDIKYLLSEIKIYFN